MQHLTNTFDDYFGCSLRNPKHYVSMTVAQLISLMAKERINPMDNLSKNQYEKRTILSFAMDADNADLVDYICSTGITIACLNEECYRECTAIYPSTFDICNPLTYCLRLCETPNRIKMAAMLLARHVDTNLSLAKPRYLTPLSISIGRKSPFTIALLVEAGAFLGMCGNNKHIEVIAELWKVYKTAFTVLFFDKVLPFELVKEIECFFVKRIAPRLV